MSQPAIAQDIKACSEHWSRGKKMNTKQKKSKKITLDKIIEMIEASGGKEGIDLSGQDLSMIDLGWEQIAAKLKSKHLKDSDNLPVWVSRFVLGRTILGLNLKKANLAGANLRLANLSGVDLTFANLSGAWLNDTCLQYTNFFRANMERAILRRADMRYARLGGTDLRGATLYRVQLEDTDLRDSRLEGANLVLANLDKADITRASLGDHLILEDLQTFTQWVKKEKIWIEPGEWEYNMPRRLIYLKEIYIGLKSSFLSHGRYGDASWAYFQEQKLNRKMHEPASARFFFGGKAAQANPGSWLWWRFHLRNLFLWLGLWGMEISCGFGEKPWRSIGLALGTILLFPFLYMASNGLRVTASALPVWSDYWIYSLGSFVTLNFSRFQLTNRWVEFLTGMEGLVGIALLALLMFALGNRISRS
jgi:uncharacterized protein YjbI with pentapeptide repeats